jgi:hypothetical protein
MQDESYLRDLRDLEHERHLQAVEDEYRPVSYADGDTEEEA